MKKLIKKIIRLCGYELVRATPRKFLSNGIRVLEQETHAPQAHAKLLANWSVTTIFDIGANVGNTVKQYRHYFPDATVHAFEPSPTCVELLHNRFLRDSLVKIVSKAVSDCPGSTELHITAADKMHSIMYRNDVDDNHNPRTNIIDIRSVPVTTVDEYVQDNQIERIDLLKIDAEGAERLILSGASRTLGAGKIVLIGLEVRVKKSFQNEALFGDIVQHLHESGFQLIDIPYISRKPDRKIQIDFADAIFISDQYYSSIINNDGMKGWRA